jgi:hypothetical protein
MQWHWGNIGAILAGVSTILVAVGALIRGAAIVRAWLDGKAADREETVARAAALREDADEHRRERHRHLYGWSQARVEAYPVALVTDPEEIDRAARGLVSGHGGGYVILRCTESAYDDNELSAQLLRELVSRDGCVTRLPTDAEREALEAGLESLGVRDLPAAAAAARH